MKIMPISTNAHKNRPVFSENLTYKQLSDIKTDTLNIKNQNQEIMKQNRYILKTLLYLAESLRYSTIDYNGSNAAREAAKKAVEGLDLIKAK